MEYQASIGISWDSGYIETENAQREEEGMEPLTGEEIQREMGENLWEIIQNMVLGREPFGFSFSIINED